MIGPMLPYDTSSNLFDQLLQFEEERRVIGLEPDASPELNKWSGVTMPVLGLSSSLAIKPALDLVTDSLISILTEFRTKIKISIAWYLHL